MTASTIILLATLIPLVVALVAEWMKPRAQAQAEQPGLKQSADISTVTLELQLMGAEDARRELDSLTSRAKELAKVVAQVRREAGMIALPVYGETKGGRYKGSNTNPPPTYPRPAAPKAPRAAKKAQRR